jgi:hypothetical protein
VSTIFSRRNLLRVAEKKEKKQIVLLSVTSRREKTPSRTVRDEVA